MQGARSPLTLTLGNFNLEWFEEYAVGKSRNPLRGTSMKLSSFGNMEWTHSENFVRIKIT